MKTAVIYTRVSTEEQAARGYSLKEQLELCQEKVRALGATNTYVCTDEGIPGELIERPGLNKAREIIRHNSIDFFVCYDPDRFARKLSYQLLVTDEIEKTGCQLVFVNFEWQNTAEGRLFYSMRGAIAEFEKEKIKQRLMGGVRRKAKEGLVTNNPGIFGYDYVKGESRLEINSEEAGVVKQIFRWFVEEQMGYNQICTRLEEIGVLTKTGKTRWAPKTVKGILANRTYIGEHVMQRYNSVGTRNNKHRSKEERVKRSIHPEDHWLTANVPRIIDEQLFGAAQKQADRVSRFFRKREWHGDYLLSGLLFCGYCGRAMSGMRNQDRRYYRCNQKSKHPGHCSSPYVKAEQLEQEIWEQIIEMVMNPELLLEAIKRQSKPDIQQGDTELLEKNLAETLKQKERLLDLVQQGIVTTDAIAARLKEIQERESKLKAILAQRSTTDHKAPKPTELARALKTMSDNITDLDFEGRKKVVRRLIDSITIEKDRVYLRAKFPPVATKGHA